MNEQIRQRDVAGIEIPTWIDGQLRPYDKLKAHTEGLRHMAISVFVMAGRSVLIQRRALHKYHTPGLWANTCCTHPEWNEPMRDCANRRLSEELGITGLDPVHKGQVEYRADVGGGLIEHEVVEVFVAEATEDLSMTPNPAEVMDTDWVDFDALVTRVDASPESYTPWLRIYLSKHRTQIFGSSNA